jgi:hypothetical protein
MTMLWHDLLWQIKADYSRTTSELPDFLPPQKMGANQNSRPYQCISQIPLFVSDALPPFWKKWMVFDATEHEQADIILVRNHVLNSDAFVEQ